MKREAERIRQLERFRLNLIATLPASSAASSGSQLAEAVAVKEEPTAADQSIPLLAPRVTGSGGQPAEVTGYNEIGYFYQWEGKTYREGRKGSNVGTHHSIEEIQEYTSECPMNTSGNNSVNEVHYESVEDWVATIRQACIAPGAAFHWPSGKLSFQTAVAVALVHLPPGCHITIRSGKPLPEKFKGASNTGELGYNAQELYHGTSLHNMIGIAESGFKAGLGAGCDALQEHFGIPVAVIYVAKTWTVASYGPMETSSSPHAAIKNGPRRISDCPGRLSPHEDFDEVSCSHD
jgi:hypothetical protein